MRWSGLVNQSPSRFIRKNSLVSRIHTSRLLSNKRRVVQNIPILDFLRVPLPSVWKFESQLLTLATRIFFKEFTYYKLVTAQRYLRFKIQRKTVDWRQELRSDTDLIWWELYHCQMNFEKLPTQIPFQFLVIKKRLWKMNRKS